MFFFWTNCLLKLKPPFIAKYTPFTAEQFTNYAQEHDVTSATLAVAWVMANPTVTAPIIGARNLDQLEDSLAAADFKMTLEMHAEISNLSRTPAPATDRTEVLTGKWK